MTLFKSWPTLAAFASLASLAAALALPVQAQAQSTMRHLAIANMVDIPQLIEVRDGLLAQLRSDGFVEGKNLKVDYLSAQGNPGTAAQIVRKFVGAAPDVIVTITTPMAQAALSATDKIPVLFTVVTDPLGAKVVKSLTHPGANATGISDLAPIERQLRLIKSFVPAARRLGVIYNPGLDGSRYQIDVLKPLLARHQLSLVEANVATSNDVVTAARSLVGKVDAIWIPNDPTVYAALESAVRIAQEQKLPLFTAETRSVERGAIASIGFDYTSVGHEAARVVLTLFKGAKPGDLPVVAPTVYRTVVNARAVKAIGLSIPADVARQANVVNP